VRAAIYYHFAKFVFVHDQKQMRDAHLRSVEMLPGGASGLCARRERVSIPFEEKPPRNPAATGGCDGTPADY